MSDETIRAAFSANFFSFHDDATLHRCLLLAGEYALTEYELAEAYDLFSLGKPGSKVVTPPTLLKFEMYLRKTFGRRSTVELPRRVEPDFTKPPSGSKSPGILSTPPNSAGKGADPVNAFVEAPDETSHQQTPPPREIAPLEAPYLTAGKSFTARKKKGLNFRVLNEHLPSRVTARAELHQGESGLLVLDVPFPRNPKFMRDTIKQKIGYIEHRIVKFGQAIKERFQLDVTNLIHLPIQEAVWMCGMVCCDGDGRLNQSSTKLLGSRTFASAKAVRLDVSHVCCFSLFPGQIIAVRAANPKGDCLRALEILPHLPTELCQVESDRMEEDTPMAESFSVFAAAGPYSSSEDLSFEALKEIADLIETHVFDLVILMGPFLDDQHPIVNSGEALESFPRILQLQVDPIIYRIQKACGQLIMVPSVRDVHHTPVFPQPPFSNQQKRNVSMLSNPCNFVYKGVTFGVCNQDVIKGLSTSTYEKEQTERMDNLFRHILGQHSYYPLFPPVVGSCVDVSYGSRLDIQTQLDVLITPSDLISYAKFLSLEARESSPRSQSEGERPCLCLNPGRVVKGKNGGTYAVLSISPGDEGSPADISKRCRVDIIGI